MKTIIQQLGLLLLMGMSHSLYATEFTNPPSARVQKVDDTAQVTITKRKPLVDGYCRAYHIPTDLCFLIRCLVYDNPFKYRNKPLPSDLSGQDLRGFDFTGCGFTHTNLTDTNLTNVILARTTCDYQKAFQDNIKKNKCDRGNWYKKNLPNALMCSSRSSSVQQ